MSYQKRRNFLKLTGGVIGIGGALSAGGSVAATRSTQDELPPLRGPYADEDWVEYRAGPGNAAAIAEAPDLDPDALEYTSFYDGEYISNQGAIVEDTMYIAGNGHVRAIDAQDASIQWTSDDVGASSSPAAAYDRIVATGGNNPVVALDIEDGSLEWETDLDGVASTPSVAYETVYLVADGSLYALDVTDGSVVWERRPEAENAEFLNRPPAASSGRIYAIADPDEETNELVALDAATGERLWGDAYHYLSGPAATEEHVAAANGLGDERFRVLDTASGDAVLEGDALTVPALDDEVAMTILDWELEATFFDKRDGWALSNFSTSALGEPTIAGDTVFVYVGDDHREAYRNSLLAIDKYDGEVTGNLDIPASQEGLGISVVTAGDTVYVFDQDEIYIVREDDSTDEDDGNGEDDASNGDDSSDEDDSSTPEDTATPAESTDDECGCPDDSGNEDSSSDGENSPTDSATPTDERTLSGESTESTEEAHQPVENATSTEETDGAGPGLGAVSAVTGLGGMGYVLRRRLGGGESEHDGNDS